MKTYHVTWDTTALDDVKTSGIVHTQSPYLFVHEIGITGKKHYHGYFTSQFSKNTIKNKLQNILKVPVYFSDPANPKYLKYNQDGALGVEIYLLKGQTNHMRSNDDLKVTPLIVWHNKTYYGNTITEARLQHIRKIYEDVITSMKNYKAEVSSIQQEKKLTEWQLILKDLDELTIDTEQQIKDYLAYTHYCREKYHFTENGFKNIYRKIMKHKNLNKYKNYIRNLMDVVTN